MNLTTSLLVLAAALSFAGCASPGQTYAQQHPELPAKQLEIRNALLVTGNHLAID